VNKQAGFVNKRARSVTRQALFVDKQACFVNGRARSVVQQALFVNKRPIFVDKRIRLTWLMVLAVDKSGKCGKTGYGQRVSGAKLILGKSNSPDGKLNYRDGKTISPAPK